MLVVLNIVTVFLLDEFDYMRVQVCLCAYLCICVCLCL